MAIRAKSRSGLRFGPFTVDARAGEIRKGARTIRVQQQPMQVLEALLARAGEVVTREELQEGIWPADTFVDFEHSLNTAIKKLRHALRDSASKPKYIETLPRRGYRFLAPVESHGQTAKPGVKKPGRLEGKVFALTADAGSEWVLAPLNAECLEEWEVLKALDDDVGISMMIADKRLMLLEAGKPVRTLKAEREQAWCEVRVLEGEHYGKAALVPRTALSDTASGPSKNKR
jgi:DNA-binding winged helix-turn-helix (wHTH) protein